MLTKRAQCWLAILTMMSLLILASACGGKKTEDASADNSGGATDTAAGTKYASTGNEGTVTGKIALKGTPPEPKKIDTSADAVCTQKNPDARSEEVVSKDGNLAYVFVYLKDGTVDGGKKITEYTFDTPADKVVLDQNGCHYKPHVVGLQTNQKLSVTNSDPTQHNIHPSPKNNPQWNQSQGPGAAPIEKSFAKSEILIPVKCDQHPWMKAWIGVVRHPYFAVSKEDGTFEIKNVPPGKYTLVAWHEKFGEQTQEITVGNKASVPLNFSFDSAATASLENSSLEIMPALEFPMLMRH